MNPIERLRAVEGELREVAASKGGRLIRRKRSICICFPDHCNMHYAYPSNASGMGEDDFRFLSEVVDYLRYVCWNYLTNSPSASHPAQAV